MARPIPAAAPCKAWVCGRSLLVVAGSNPARGIDVSVSYVVHVDVSATCRSIVEGNPTECVCVRERIIKRNSKPLHLRGVEKKRQEKVGR